MNWIFIYGLSVQFSHSSVSDSATPWIAACQPSLSITNSQSLIKLMSMELMMPSSHLILCRPLLLLPPIPPSIRVFSNDSTLRMRWPKYWSFSFSIIPSKEIPGLTSFRMDWLDLLAVQGTLRSLLQHHSSKASILRRSAFFTVQLLHPYMTTGKTIALTKRTFVGKVMSLLFNMLSRLVLTFLPRSKRLLISWLKSPSAVILEPKKIVWHCFHCFSIYFPWSDGTRCHDLRKMLLMNLFAGQQQRCRLRDQTLHSRRRRGCDVGTKLHVNIQTNICKIDSQGGICCVTEETQPWAPWPPRGVGWGGRWEGVQEEGEHVYTYGWCMWMDGRHQHINVKPLSFNYNISELIKKMVKQARHVKVVTTKKKKKNFFIFAPIFWKFKIIFITFTQTHTSLIS